MAIIETGIQKVIYGSENFEWIIDVKFSKDKLKLEGPIMQEKCRELFIKKLKEKGREDILNYKRKPK